MENLLIISSHGKNISNYFGLYIQLEGTDRVTEPVAKHKLNKMVELSISYLFPA